MADISSSKPNLFSLRMCVMIFVGASLLCDRISALEIITEKTVSLWLHRPDQSIPCDVRLGDGERIAGFSWSKVQNVTPSPPEDTTSSPRAEGTLSPRGETTTSLNVIMKVFRGAASGPGMDSGEFSLSENRSLVFHRSPSVEDEGFYVCKVVLWGAPEGQQNSSTIRVLSAPKEPHPTIRECATSDELEREEEMCIINREAGTSLNLTCEVSGFRPLVDLIWTNASQVDIAGHRTLFNNSDGTQSMFLTFEVNASLERQEFSCSVSGEAVSGHKSSVVAVQGVAANGSPLVVIIVIVVAILLVVFVLLIVVVFVLKSRRRRSRSSEEKVSKQEQLTDVEKGSDDRQIENNHYTPDPVSVVVQEPPVETRLNEGTQTDIPEPQEEDQLSTTSEEREQSQGLLNGDEREESQSNSIGPSQLSSRSDIAHPDFGESWVCVSPEELRNLQERKDNGNSEDQPGERHPSPGHLRSIIQGLGNLFNTFNNVIRHDA